MSFSFSLQPTHTPTVMGSSDSTMAPASPVVESLLPGMTCPVCFSLFACPTSKAFTAPCSHTFCETCLGRLVGSRQCCPLDRRPLPGIEQCVRTRALEAVGETLMQLCHEQTEEADARLVVAVREVVTLAAERPATDRTVSSPRTDASPSNIGDPLVAADVTRPTSRPPPSKETSEGDSECPVCRRTLAILSLDERTRHVNLCVDELERNERRRCANPTTTAEGSVGSARHRLGERRTRRRQTVSTRAADVEEHVEFGEPPSYSSLFRWNVSRRARAQHESTQLQRTRAPPQLPIASTKSCGHFCCLTSTPRCCSCADMRRPENGYRRYRDGRRWVNVPHSDAERRRDYCPTCRTGRT